MKVHIPVTPAGDLACSTSTPSAFASHRDLCKSCDDRISDLVATAVLLSRLRGAADLAATDKRVARILDWLRRFEAQTDGAAVEGPES